MAMRQGLPEVLKEADQMKCVGLTNSASKK